MMYLPQMVSGEEWLAARKELLAKEKETHDEDEEFVFVRIAGSNINDHGDVVDARLRHSWGGAQALNLDDFRT